MQEKLASQSGEVKALSEEAAALRSELKTVVEETQVGLPLFLKCVTYGKCATSFFAACAAYRYAWCCALYTLERLL